MNINIKILSQNIVNNPSDFTAQEIENYFEGYALQVLREKMKKSVSEQDLSYERKKS